MAAARKTPACARALDVADAKGTAALVSAAESTTCPRSNRPSRSHLPQRHIARRHSRTRGWRQGSCLPLAGLPNVSRRCSGGDGASAQHARHPAPCAKLAPVSLLITQGLPMRPPRWPEAPRLRRPHPKTVFVAGATGGLASKLAVKVGGVGRREQYDEAGGCETGSVGDVPEAPQHIVTQY